MFICLFVSSLLQVPLFVATKILPLALSTFLAPTPEVYSKSCLRWIGYEPICLPYWLHSLQGALVHAMPKEFLGWLALKCCLHLRKIENAAVLEQVMKRKNEPPFKWDRLEWGIWTCLKLNIISFNKWRACIILQWRFFSLFLMVFFFIYFPFSFNGPFAVLIHSSSTVGRAFLSDQVFCRHWCLSLSCLVLLFLSKIQSTYSSTGVQSLP